MRSKGRYTLDEFWRVKMDVGLPGKTVQVRTLGDWEIQERDREASLAQLLAKREMEDKESPRRKAIEQSIAESNKEDLVAVLCLLKMGEAISDEKTKTDPRVVIIPDKPTPEEKEEALEDRLKAVRDWEEKCQRAAEARVEQYRVSFEKQAVKDLQKEMLAAQIRTEARLAFLHTEDDYTLLYCAEYNNKPLFKSIEEARGCNSRIKQVILQSYIDVAGVDIFDMENFSVTDCSTEPS